MADTPTPTDAQRETAMRILREAITAARSKSPDDAFNIIAQALARQDAESRARAIEECAEAVDKAEYYADHHELAAMVRSLKARSLTDGE